MDELFDLLQHFALLVPPSSLQFPAGSFDVAHGFLLNHILLDPHLNAYPPSSEYRVVFWKWAVTHLEDLAKNKACSRSGVHLIVNEGRVSRTLRSTREYTILLSLSWIVYLRTCSPVAFHATEPRFRKDPKALAFHVPLSHLSSPIIGT